MEKKLTCTWMVRAATLSFNVPELTTDLNHCESDDFSLAFTARQEITMAYCIAEQFNRTLKFQFK